MSKSFDTGVVALTDLGNGSWNYFTAGIPIGGTSHATDIDITLYDEAPAVKWLSATIREIDAGSHSGAQTESTDTAHLPDAAGDFVKIYGTDNDPKQGWFLNDTTPIVSVGTIPYLDTGSDVLSFTITVDPSVTGVNARLVVTWEEHGAGV